MVRYLYKALIVCYATSLFASPAIHITKTVRDIANHLVADAQNLIICDLDLTFVKTPGVLGSDPWFYYMLQKHEAIHPTHHDALHATVSLYTIIHNTINLELVEHDAAEIIHQLQELDHCHVMAVTARSATLIDRTLSELTRLGIHFACKAPVQHPIIFNDLPFKAEYKDGVLFCSSNDKGIMLKEFLQHTTLLDASKKLNVIAIDDKEKYLHQIHNALQEYPNVSFVGLHFTLLEEFVASFNSVTADEELKILLTQIS